jgi:hypothetical protein
MLRVVVAVALATALLGAATPAVDSARIDHADARVQTELDELVTTADRLVERNDPAPPGVRGARRILTLYLPGPSWGSAGLERLSVPGPSADRPRGTVRWRVEGGRETTRWVSAPLVGPEGGLSLRGGGARRVVLELARRNDDPVVVVRRPDFKSDDGPTAAHDAHSASRLPRG